MTFITLCGGRQLDPWHITADDISIADIGNTLGHICRWGGMGRFFYSVAEHSVLVSRQVSPDNALWALLHDAAETYIGDMVAPLKAQFPDFKRLEQHIMLSVCEAFGLPPEEPEEVKVIDRRLRATEAITLDMQPHLWGGLDVSPLPVRVECLLPGQAKALFFERYEELVPCDEQGGPHDL